MSRPSSSVTHTRLVSLAEERDKPSPSGEGEYGVCGYILIFFGALTLLLFFPFSLFWSLKVVQEYERAVIFRLGRIKSSRAHGPGLFFLMPCVDNFVKVDLRTFTFNIAPQEILTKDSVTIVVDAVIYASIYDATKSTVNVRDARGSTLLLGATTLRTMLGTVGLSDILSSRERIDRDMQNTLDMATHDWGVKVERVEIKDVRLPVQMQRAMAAEAESTRMARAKVIAADGEQKASRCIKEAADVMAESPSSLQLRYLQTLHSISEQQNHTIVLPFPKDLLSGLGLQQSLPIAPTGPKSTPYVADSDQQTLVDVSGGDTQF